MQLKCVVPPPVVVGEHGSELFRCEIELGRARAELCIACRSLELSRRDPHPIQRGSDCIESEDVRIPEERGGR